MKEKNVNFNLDQIKIEDGVFKFIDSKHTVEIFVENEDENEDEEYKLVKSHSFRLFRSQVVWDLCHSCTMSGKLKRMFANEDFELSDSTLVDILLDAKCIVKPTKIETGEQFFDPRWADIKQDETERPYVMLMFTNIDLSEEGEELVLELYKDYKEKMFSK